jgi:hypothetical protein
MWDDALGGNILEQVLQKKWRSLCDTKVQKILDNKDTTSE